jgi:hypothetical protein
MPTCELLVRVLLEIFLVEVLEHGVGTRDASET